MSTRLEGVTIPVDLDTSKAEKQLDQLEASLQGKKKKADEVSKSVEKNGVRPPAGSVNTTGVSGGTRSPSARPGSLSIPRQDTLSESPPASGVLGKISMLAGRTSQIAKGAAGGAAVYAATRTIAMGSPLALEAGRAAVGLSPDDPLFKAVQGQLDNLKNSVNYVESYVKSVVTGATKTYDMATAMARVNGRLPNIQIGYGIYREAEMQEDMLKKKFEHFKQMEVATGVGNSMAEMFRGGLNR